MKGTRAQVRRVEEEEKNKTIMKECVCCVCEEENIRSK